MKKWTPVASSTSSSARPQSQKKRHTKGPSPFDTPLPTSEVCRLPPLVAHNPITWLSYATEYFFPRIPPKTRRFKCLVVRHGRVVVIRVDDAQDQLMLWNQGFFGKGVYSRSDSSWFARTARRLDLEEAKSIPLTAEERTNLRRLERAKFKEERARLEQERLDRIRRREMGEDVELLPEDAKVDRAQFNTFSMQNLDVEKRPGDELLLDENGKLISVEYVQLMPYEALFLSEFLGVLDVYAEGDPTDKLTGWRLVKAIVPPGQSVAEFLAYYAGYHSFRAKGWCARSGVKFASDFVLYRRGPPFSHADFTAIVHPVLPHGEDDGTRWFESTRSGRVVGGVKKTMIYCYVEVPNLEYEAQTVREVLEQCKVTTVSHVRWRPMKSRD